MVRQNRYLLCWKNTLKIRCLNRLHLPTEIVPATHKKAARPARPAGIRAGGEGAYRAPRPDREEYRKKDSAPSGEFRPQFAGVGRGGSSGVNLCVFIIQTLSLVVPGDSVGMLELAGWSGRPLSSYVFMLSDLFLPASSVVIPRKIVV